jgi:hypothetical protein
VDDVDGNQILASDRITFMTDAEQAGGDQFVHQAATQGVAPHQFREGAALAYILALVGIFTDLDQILEKVE